LDALKTYLTGRAGRREYWIWLIAILVGAFGLGVATRNNTLVSLLSMIPWCVVSTRRLRDAGLTPWLCLFPFGSGFVIGAVFGFLRSVAPASAAGQVSPLALSLIIGAISWSFLIYLGVRHSRAAAPSPAAA